VDGSIPEELDVAQYGHPKAPRGTWASCIRLLNPFSGTTIFQTEFVNNEAAISMADVVFMAHPDERLLVVGTVTGMVIGAGPVTFQRGGLRVYKVKFNLVLVVRLAQLGSSCTIKPILTGFRMRCVHSKAGC
jgi:CPSF A subunit region